MENGKYNLEERTATFGEHVIQLLQRVPKNAITIPIINQLIRAATSVGANYCEACGAESRSDFEHKISICKKEAKETKHWFRMLCVADPSFRKEVEILSQEASELILIFSAALRTSKVNRIANTVSAIKPSINLSP